MTQRPRRRLLATCVAVLALALLYEATVLDSRRVVPQAADLMAAAVSAAASPLRFSATAYCKGTTTAAGVPVVRGIAAADPAYLPVGSVVRASALGATYDGIYTVMDTGPAVRGRTIDLYFWSCTEALKFGRRSVWLDVLRLGWNPAASTPELIKGLLRRK